MHGEPAPEPSLFAPWSWSARDRKLGKTLEKRFKELGVRDELCFVGMGNEND